MRLPALLALSCLGPGLLVLGGRAGLRALQPPLTPATATATLAWVHRWSADPGRRREAALLLDGRAAAAEDPALRGHWLQAQGWGTNPLAAVALRRAAVATTALGEAERSGHLWRQLLRRFPDDPLSADALYHLGREQPALRRQLLQRWPAHPAALAAALEAGPAPADRLGGALHLARFGPRWPGADERLRASCAMGNPGPGPQERGELAAALAGLGDGGAALSCLGPGGQLTAAGQLALGRALLKGTPEQVKDGQQRLFGLIRRQPSTAVSGEAIRLLSQQPGEDGLPLLRQLPASARAHTAVQARLALAAGEAGNNGPALTLLQRRPDDPASQDLQWDLTRRALLAGQWAGALRLLNAIPAERQPPALAARQRFWVGYSLARLGRQAEAQARWRQLLERHPSGYYGWRAAARLGEADLRLTAAAGVGAGAASGEDAWAPLESGEPLLDRFWQLDLREEAWERWRSQRGGRPPANPNELMIEGRLRQGVGDDWTGLGQLEQASLQLAPGACAAQARLDRDLHPRRHWGMLQAVAAAEELPDGLLAAVARQESRFSSGVRSAAGAVGLLQLMPETAGELAGRPVSPQELENPERNAALGGRYLRQLLDRWDGDPWLTVASYNAGPGAVEGWLDPGRQAEPELWAERIPFPETRIYVKKVLGNLWTYQNPRRRPLCQS